jgi:RNA polymerase sigma factor (TIGR02999 family)
MDPHATTSTGDLFPRVYRELRRLAARRLSRERVSGTLQPTALVHEAFLRLSAGGSRFESDAQFHAAAATAMQRILVERARRRRRLRHGGAWVRVPLDGVDIAGAAVDVDAMALAEALDELARVDPQAARVVELRHFAGLTVEETAGVLGVSPRTVKREWSCARLFLFERLGDER